MREIANPESSNKRHLFYQQICKYNFLKNFSKQSLSKRNATAILSEQEIKYKSF